MTGGCVLHGCGLEVWIIKQCELSVGLVSNKGHGFNLKVVKWKPGAI